MKWDDHALRLAVVDTDEETRSDIVHWVQKFPFPFNNRDYLYARRYCFDTSTDSHPKIIVKCHSIDHPKVRFDKGCVRVNQYESSMIIQSKTRLDEVSDLVTATITRPTFIVCLERNEISLDVS